MGNSKTLAKSSFSSEEQIQLPARDALYEPHSTPSSEVSADSRNKGREDAASSAETGKMSQRASLQESIESKRLSP